MSKHSYETPLRGDDLKLLRDKNLISDTEIALRIGDLIVAESVTTKERRVVETGALILESRRRVLRD